MQTFIISHDPVKTAEMLDRQRLGKQRIEAIQIARVLIGLSSGWKNHPAVKRWKGYLPYLVKTYLKSMLVEWEKRGYKNTKSNQQYLFLLDNIQGPVIKPEWITDDLIVSHQSNLLRKCPEHYKQYFNVPDDLPYIW